MRDPPEPEERQGALPSPDGFAEAAEKLGEIFRWVVAGSGIESMSASNGRRAGNGGQKPAMTVGKRMLALILVTRPDLLRDVRLSEVARISGINESSLCIECRRIERTFGRIGAVRARAIKPHISGQALARKKYVAQAEGRSSADMVRDPDR